MLVLILVFNSLSRINVHEDWVDIVRKSRQSSLLCDVRHFSLAVFTDVEVNRRSQILVEALSSLMLIELLWLDQ